MLLTLCILLHCGVPDSIVVYSGRERQLDVRIPRFDAEVVIDGDLADSAWRHAALLTGFSQYAPNDGVSARIRRRCWCGIPPPRSTSAFAPSSCTAGRPRHSPTVTRSSATTTCRTCSAHFTTANR